MVTTVPLRGLQRGRTASVPVPPLSPLPQFPHLHSVWWQWGRGHPILSLCHISDPAPNPAPTAAQPAWLLPAALGCTVQQSCLALGVVPDTMGGSGLCPPRGPTAGWGPLSSRHCHVAMGAWHTRVIDGDEWGTTCPGTARHRMLQPGSALTALWHSFAPSTPSAAQWPRGCGQRAGGVVGTSGRGLNTDLAWIGAWFWKRCGK